MQFRPLVASLFVLVAWGCGTPPVPALPRPEKMTVVIQPMEGWGHDHTETIEVDSDNFERIYQLVKPTRTIDGDVNKVANPLFAKMLLKYPDGSQQELFVRWMGKNPAGVSLDDKHYFWGGAPPMSDGCTEIYWWLKVRKETKPNAPSR